MKTSSFIRLRSRDHRLIIGNMRISMQTAYWEFPISMHMPDELMFIWYGADAIEDAIVAYNTYFKKWEESTGKLIK